LIPSPNNYLVIANFVSENGEEEEAGVRKMEKIDAKSDDFLIAVSITLLGPKPKRSFYKFTNRLAYLLTRNEVFDSRQRNV
jgi:hypothetical protein